MKHSCAVFISRFSVLKDDGFLAELEARLLFFTASVVLLACASFAFGGTCAAWQWYVPLVLASVWFRGGGYTSLPKSL